MWVLFLCSHDLDAHHVRSHCVHLYLIPLEEEVSNFLIFRVGKKKWNHLMSFRDSQLTNVANTAHLSENWLNQPHCTGLLAISKGNCRMSIFFPQPQNFANIWLLNKPYENRVSLRGQIPPKNSASLVNFWHALSRGLDLFIQALWVL